MSELISMITCDNTLNACYLWICKQRAHASDNNTTWDLRFHWPQTKQKIMPQLLNGSYQFSPVKQYQINGEIRSVWSPEDAIALKAITLVLSQYLKPILSKYCFHLAGHGGLKAAVRTVDDQLRRHPFFLRSDVKSYDASMNHHILYEQLSQLINDKIVLRLLWQYMRYLTDVDGALYENRQGISLGCPLSPLIAAVYLKPLDDAMAKLPVKYTRYMDDWCILAKTRGDLRKAIRVMYHALNDLKLVVHPDKTEMGRPQKGFDFLGYHFTPGVVTVATKTWQNFQASSRKLFEQGASAKRLADYWRDGSAGFGAVGVAVNVLYIVRYCRHCI